MAKRFKVTGRGKAVRTHAGRRHLCLNKSPKRRRHLRNAPTVDSTDQYRVLANLPFTH